MDLQNNFNEQMKKGRAIMTSWFRRLLGNKSEAGAASRSSILPSIGSRGTMLEVYLSSMPRETQVQQKARFARVVANFEFGFFVHMQAAERLVGEAMQKGFTVWANVDSTSAFLYGTGMVDQDEVVNVMNWLRTAAVSGQKIQVGIHNLGEPIRFVEISI